MKSNRSKEPVNFSDLTERQKNVKLHEIKTELGLAHYIINHRYTVAPYMLDWALACLERHSKKGES